MIVYFISDVRSTIEKCPALKLWHRFFLNGSKPKITREPLSSYWLISFNWKISSIDVIGCSNYEHFIDLPLCPISVIGHNAQDI